MNNIRTWNNSSVTTWDNSGIVTVKWKNNDTKVGNFSRNISYKEKAWWFFSGFILPLIVGLLVEFLSKWAVSEAFWKVVDLFR